MKDIASKIINVLKTIHYWFPMNVIGVTLIAQKLNSITSKIYNVLQGVVETMLNRSVLKFVLYHVLIKK